LPEKQKGLIMNHLHPVAVFLICLVWGVFSGQNLAALAGEKESIYLKWQFSFGKTGSGPGEFNRPQALSVDPAGSILVCDTENHRIQKFDRRGKFQKEVGGFGWQTDQFFQPTDVHARSALDIFVADYQNQRVVRYDRQLFYLSAMQANPVWDERFQFTHPRAIAFSNQREIFLLDDENYRVIKFNNLGEPLTRFGDFSRAPGQLQQPRQIELDGNERIFVSDAAANAVLVFDYFGNYLTCWGETVLKEPTGLFWADRRLLVADSGNRRIVIFNATGVPLEISDAGEKLLTFPVDVALFEAFIYILDAEQDCVHVFEWSKKVE
jgi:DNA-binding beta-propeller fold protein YncE